MKQHLLVLAALAGALAISTTGNAQFELAANTKKIAPAPAAASEFESTTAYKKFHKAFSGISDESWVKTKEGFSVAFRVKGILNRVYLTKGGAQDGLMRYYDEADLPQAVSQLVKNTYDDYTITSVQEVTCNHETAYLVSIDGKTKWKVIRVVDGEADVWEEHSKAN